MFASEIDASMSVDDNKASATLNDDVPDYEQSSVLSVVDVCSFIEQQLTNPNISNYLSLSGMYSESDSDGELVRVTSTPLPPPKWDKVPEDKEYKLKLRLTGPAGKRKRRGYLLKRGIALPYTTNIEGEYIWSSFFIEFESVQD